MVIIWLTDPKQHSVNVSNPVLPGFLKGNAMTSKPASGRALCLAVAHCSHPDLDPTDKALLLYLAVNADHATGRNSRPGNPALCHFTTLQRSAVNARLEKNIQRKLIERTKVGNGRSTASVYRLCIESSCFPDQTPTGEWLIEEKMSGSERTVSDNKVSGLGRTDSPQTVRPSAGNCPAQPPKLSGAEAETVRQLPDDTNPSPETHQLPTNTSTFPEWVGRLFFDHNQQTLQLRKDDRLQFMAAIKQHGEVIVAAAWREFVKTGWYNAETKFPGYVFFKDGNSDLYVQAAIRKLNIERERNDPARIAAVERNVQRQKEEHWERMTKTPAPENGGDVLEYLAELDARQDRYQDDMNKASAARYADAYSAAMQPVAIGTTAGTDLDQFLAMA
jgi:hypothetical protein